jgi:hypothetical protein
VPEGRLVVATDVGNDPEVLLDSGTDGRRLSPTHEGQRETAMRLVEIPLLQGKNAEAVECLRRSRLEAGKISHSQALTERIGGSDWIVGAMGGPAQMAQCVRTQLTVGARGGCTYGRPIRCYGIADAAGPFALLSLFQQTPCVGDLRIGSRPRTRVIHVDTHGANYESIDLMRGRDFTAPA